MNNKTQNRRKGSAKDTIIWCVIGALFIAAVIGHYYFFHLETIYKVIAWILVIAASVALSTLTKSGEKIFALIKDSINEMYKVVWPTRAETYQSTLIVIVIVAIITLLIWGIDSILVGVIGRLTGR